ncbi:MAG TPA: glutamyl-tRNA reductase [Dehalococcoidia bacterium]|nr:glutamyl-tRNA reductase [Dehalococcoidia bacterium]
MAGGPSRLLAVGVSHRTAPVAVREALAFTPQEVPEALAVLGGRFGTAVLLSTCNRTELYVSAAAANRVELVAALEELKGLKQPLAPAHFYALDPAQAAGHLFRVASGVDSMVVGEAQILGQVRDALSLAHQAGTTDGVLSRLFHQAIAVGRRVRRETAIGGYALSVSGAAALQAQRELGSLRGCTVLIISAGSAGKLAARSLRKSGARLLITSRTHERARELARALEGEAVIFSALPAALAQADVVISSTGSYHHVLGPEDVAEAMAGRPSRPLLLLDIAVPRDIDPRVQEIEGVRLYNIDDLQELLRVPTEEVARVEAIVEEEAARFLAWWEKQDGLALIADLHQRAEAIRCQEMERTLSRLPGLSAEERDRLEAMSRAIVKKLLHPTVAHLRRDSGHIEAARRLLGLGGEAGAHGPASAGLEKEAP